jgi:hypothetical protein
LATILANTPSNFGDAAGHPLRNDGIGFVWWAISFSTAVSPVYKGRPVNKYHSVTPRL